MYQLKFLKQTPQYFDRRTPKCKFFNHYITTLTFCLAHLNSTHNFLILFQQNAKYFTVKLFVKKQIQSLNQK